MLYLLDSSAVLNDFAFQFSPAHSYLTTSLVFNEFKDMRSRHLAENALHRGLLRIAEPSANSLKAIEGKIAEKGFSKLSKPDVSLLALALDLKKKREKFRAVSDDYSVQNFCKLLGIPFEGVIRGRIRETISFSLLCPACGKTVRKGSKAKKQPFLPKQKTLGKKGNAPALQCPICGTALKSVKAKGKA